jgi:thiamine biosynthesis lipoprotein
VLSATVIAPTLLEAEMAAKVVLLRGSRDGLRWLAEHPALMGLIVTDHGELLGSPALLQTPSP